MLLRRPRPNRSPLPLTAAMRAVAVKAVVAANAQRMAVVSAAATVKAAASVAARVKAATAATMEKENRAGC